jgi:hypothetical protein
MNSLIFNGVPFDSAQGTPFIDFLGFHCVLKRTVLREVTLNRAFSVNLGHKLFHLGTMALTVIAKYFPPQE